MSRRSIHFRQFRESTSSDTVSALLNNNSHKAVSEGRTRRFKDGKQTAGIKSNATGTLPMAVEKIERLAAILHRTRS